MVKESIKLNNPERFTKPHSIDRAKLEAAAKAATEKLRALAEKYGDAFPETRSIEFKYQCSENKNWEAGMYTGCYWLAYELTGDEFFRECAERQLESYKTRYEGKIGLDSHDVGFVYSPSCVAAYKLTGNEEAKELALKAAEYLYEKSYSKEGKFIIRSWKGWDGGWGCRTMMDSLMNAPLFSWASLVSGDQKYTEAAKDHVKTTEMYLIREDASSFHHYQFDPKDASPVNGVTLQGRSDDSCWARGHAWGVYGLPIAYSYSKADYLPELHKNITYFMLNHLPEDLIPYWDYDFVDGIEPRDSSAALISVCGLHEMVKMLPDSAEQKKIFESAASQMLEAVIDNCTGDIGVKHYDGLVCHVTHAKPQGQGIDECAVYGDYFYLEALARYLKPDFKMYW